MRPLIEEFDLAVTPEAVVEQAGARNGLVLLRSAYFDSPHARHTFIAANPFLIFRSYGSRCELEKAETLEEQYGNPWHLLDALMTQYELLDELDLPFPLGGCFGYWGYDLKGFVEPKLTRNAVNDLELPDCWVGFYSSVLVIDHRLGKTWIVSTGLNASGVRSEAKARADCAWWKALLKNHSTATPNLNRCGGSVSSSTSREDFISAVEAAQRYIRLGHIYQANLSHRLHAEYRDSGWALFRDLKEISPAPFSAYMHCGDFEICSSSPEMFLRMSGSQIRTRPIKGTRPRGADATRDAQLSYELQTSAKEISELVMITDLLRNDLGRVCEFGSIQVPDLVQLERYPQVQHLVSTVEGTLRSDITHFAAFASCFPGGSITGAPKIRAMEIIDELEPLSRGPYTGALGYLGFNRETQLSIIIRTAIVKAGRAYFNVGAGIVAESSPEAEYEETLAKARGFISSLGLEENSLLLHGRVQGKVEGSPLPR